MSYDNPIYQSYNVGSPHDFGAAADQALSIKGPAGYKGRVVDVVVSATEVFTTGGDVQLGVAAALGQYVDMPLGTLADEAVLTASEGGDTVLKPFAAGSATEIDADSDVVVSLLQTGGTPTGQAHVNITIAWFK